MPLGKMESDQVINRDDSLLFAAESEAREKRAQQNLGADSSRLRTLDQSRATDAGTPQSKIHGAQKKGEREPHQNR